MMGALIGMLVVVAVLGVIALAKGRETFTLGARTGLEQLAKLLPILLVAMLIAGFTEVLLPKKTVETWLSDASGTRGIAIAWLAGALTPAGTIVGLPIVASLAKVGAGAGVLVTYMTSMALLSFLRVPMEAGIVGTKLTAIRIAASVLLPPIAGLSTQAMFALLRR